MYFGLYRSPIPCDLIQICEMMVAEVDIHKLLLRHESHSWGIKLNEMELPLPEITACIPASVFL